MSDILCWFGLHRWGEEYQHLWSIHRKCVRCGEVKHVRSLLDSRRTP